MIIFKKTLTYWVIKNKKSIGQYQKSNFAKLFKNFKLTKTNKI